MRKGWTLTEMIVTIGVMGVLLTLALNALLFTLKAGSKFQSEVEFQDFVSSQVEGLVGKVLRARAIKIFDRGLSVFLEGGWETVDKTVKSEKFSGEWEFSWEKPNLLSAKLKVKGEGFRERKFTVKVFVPLWKREGEGG